MTTPRVTRLHAAASPGALRDTIVALADVTDAIAARRCAILVPTRAAAEQLRRTIEQGRLRGSPAVALPHLLTRHDWLAWLFEHLPSAPSLLSACERHVLLGQAAREAHEDGAPAPFALRPALVDEMLAFYDTCRRQLKTVDDVERLGVERFERDAEEDRGAARLLTQTRFMVAAFRGYERSLEALGRSDEHTLRRRLLDGGVRLPLSRVVVTIGDRASDAFGLWAADFDLLARLPGLDAIDVVATDAALAAGLRQRLLDHLPGIEIAGAAAADARPRPVLRTTAASPFRLFRDREDELGWIARDVKRAARAGRTPSLARTAVVFKRPLPYVYLAGQIFPAAGVPHETFDALPLASEPFAAAVDLVLECADASFSRAAVVALLRSPHFRFEAAGRPVGRFAVSLLDRALSEARYRGDAAELARLAATWASAVNPGEGESARGALLALAAGMAAALPRELAALTADRPPSVHLDALLAFLAAHTRGIAPNDANAPRRARARAAVLSAIEALRDAHRRFGDHPCPPSDTAASLRRWIERQTFAPRRGSGGLLLTDAGAARYGEFDAVYVVGLTQRDWPGSEGRSIFFPAAVLRDLSWPDDADLRASERAAFTDLLNLAASRVLVSTFTLEDDAIAEPSPFLEDLGECGLQQVIDEPASVLRVSAQDALAADPVRVDAVSGEAGSWLALRQARSSAAEDRFHGQAGAQPAGAYKVSALDHFVSCPFRYFAEQVLRIKEEPEDEESLSPRAQGKLLHEVFEAFFTAWRQQGRGAVAADTLDSARQLFREIAEHRLASLPEGDAAIERARLLGSAAAPGLGDVVLGLEAERPADIVDRLLEFPLQGDATLRTPGGSRVVALRATADRIDLLADGTFRLFDYKLTRPPEMRLAVQLPAYAAAARARLQERDGRSWQPADAAYIAFAKPPYYKPLAADPAKLDGVLAEGEARLAGAVDRIERGDFPPQPHNTRICSYCPFAPVCRKDYVSVE